MFGNRDQPPSCPVDPTDKEWIEQRMEWLVRHFGWERLYSAEVILATPEYFPDDYHGAIDDAQVILERICEYMEVDPYRLELHVHRDDRPIEDEPDLPPASERTGNIKSKHRVWVEASALDDPLVLVASFARELAHFLLRGHGRASDAEEDYWPLTDLLTVFLGMGVFTANAVLIDKSWGAGAVGYWTMRRRGYLSMPTYGYALALFAWSRRENMPSWADELRPDVRSAFDEGQRFLAETAESRFGRQELPALSDGIQDLSSTGNRPVRDESALAQSIAPGPSPAVQCRYCGDELDSGDGDVCSECQDSIADNERELANERRETHQTNQIAWLFLLGGTACFVACYLAFLLVSWLI